MPWKIVENDTSCGSKPWGVRKVSDNELEGCHATKAKAQRQVAALNAAEDEGASIREAVLQANAEESLVAPFTKILAATRKAALDAEFVGDITAAWAEAVDSFLVDELTKQVAVMAEVSAINNGIDIETLPPQPLADVATEHLAGVSRYSQLLEGTVFKAQVKDPTVSFADALAKVLSVERAQHLAEGLTQHVRNGVEVAVLSKGASLSLTAAAATDPFSRRKVWISMRDDRVRAAHVRAHGQSVPVAGVFLVGGYPARYPGDPALPPALRINCRCINIRADDIDAQNSDSVLNVMEGMIARRQEKLAAARRMREARKALDAAAETGLTDSEIVDVVAEKAASELDGGALIAQIIEASPEAAAALEGGGASGLIAALKDNPSIAILVGYLLGIFNEDEEFAATGATSMTIDGDCGCGCKGAGDCKPDPRAAAARALVARRRTHLKVGTTHAKMVSYTDNSNRNAIHAASRGIEFMVAGPDHTTGVMVCVRPTDEQIAQIVHSDGLPPEEIHCTLAYFGTTDELDNPDQLQEIIREVASEFEPLAGEISGVAVFEANELRPLVALVDVPGLGAVRDKFMRAAKAALGEDHQPMENHDFSPHITFGYEASEDGKDEDAVRDRAGVPLTFEALELVFGTETTKAYFGTDGSVEDNQRRAAELEELRMTDTMAAVEAENDDLDGANGEIEVGVSVSVAETDMVGIVTDIITSGIATDSQGSEMEATENDPAYMVDVWEGNESSGITVATRLSQLDTIPPLDGETHGEDKQVGEAATMDVVTADDVVTEAEELTGNAARAAAGDFEWTGVLVVEGIESGDRRRIAEGALTWRDLPVALMLQTDNPETGGHAGATIAGSIWSIERIGNEIVGWGFFDSGGAGQEARRLLDEGTMKGVSVDLDMVEVEIEFDELNAEAMPKILLRQARVMGATITPFPAFQEAKLEILDGALVAAAISYLGFEYEVDDRPVQVWRTNIPFNVTVDPTLDPLVASGAVVRQLHQRCAPIEPPRDWFANTPRQDSYYGVEIELDGRVHGYVTDWTTCHIGFFDRCVTAPRNFTDYNRFRQGPGIVCDDGTKVKTGVVYVGCGHADLRLNADQAMEAMSNAGHAVADVVPYDTPHGIYIAGALRPNATPVQVRAFQGAKISPDWRALDGRSELVGMVVVNTSGLVPAALVAAAIEQGLTISADGTAHVLWDFENEAPFAMVAVGIPQDEIVDPMERLQADISEIKAFLAPLRIAAARERMNHARSFDPPPSPTDRVTAALERISSARSG